ncbi:MAG: peptidoglycan glycosyltransferase [Chloroflexaceae bacterium]|nr:peptidoglycan glycosyltransferase [Chloroflexaceae bacterium]
MIWGNSFSHRLWLLHVVLVVMMGTLTGRLYQLQLVSGDRQRFGGTVEVNTTRYVPVQPRRGEILASDGKTLLAESVPTFAIAVMPSRLPSARSEPERRELVLGRLAQVVELTSTLAISPTSALWTTPGLAQSLAQIGGTTTLSQSHPLPTDPPAMRTFDVSPHHTLDAIELARQHHQVLTFHNPIEQLISHNTTRYYQLAVIKENISPDLALAVRENSLHLPGVEVVEHYQRRYPQSARIPSLSHLLGYIGSIDECELVTENPAISWLDSLLDILGHTVNCGILQKHINPRVIGILPYLHNDRIGKYGLEASYESVLRGSIGINSLLVDAFERPVGDSRVRYPVQDGQNLVLTIDPAFQLQTEHILHRWIAEGEARRQNASEAYKRDYPPITSGVAIAMDPRTGEVLSMVSLPAYDNNIWVDPSRADELRHLLNPSDEELQRLSPLFNRAIAGLYPPGSSLKQFVGAVALQKNVIGVDTKLRDPGKIILEERGGTNFVLPNSTTRDNGEITVSDALMVSSNVFFASVAGGNEDAINLGAQATRIQGLGIEGLSEGLGWFHFGRTTTITLPREASGRVPDPIWKSHVLREPWTTGDTYNTAIGQGYLEVTPLQLITAAAAVANGGTIYRPQLVQVMTDNTGAVIHTQQPEALSHVPIDPTYLAVVHEGMRRSVTEGYNRAARDACSGVSIAGKTGTAEFGAVITRADGTQTRRSHAWFVGFAPYEDPQVIALVLIEGTGDLNDGSATLAVPAVTQIIQSALGIQAPADRPGYCPDMPQW